MIRESDLVVLTHDNEEYNLKTGDVGAVVHCYADDLGYEVEFVTAEGKTIAVLTMTAADIRSISHAEIFHVREVSSVLPDFEANYPEFPDGSNRRKTTN